MKTCQFTPLKQKKNRLNHSMINGIKVVDFSSFYVKFVLQVFYFLYFCTEIGNVANSRDFASVSSKMFTKKWAASFKKAQCQLTTYFV